MHAYENTLGDLSSDAMSCSRAAPPTFGEHAEQEDLAHWFEHEYDTDTAENSHNSVLDDVLDAVPDVEQHVPPDVLAQVVPPSVPIPKKTKGLFVFVSVSLSIFYIYTLPHVLFIAQLLASAAPSKLRLHAISLQPCKEKTPPDTLLASHDVREAYGSDVKLAPQTKKFVSDNIAELRHAEDGYELCFRDAADTEFARDRTCVVAMGLFVSLFFFLRE